MRSFQPIARRMAAERNRNLWTPPPTLRRIAWCTITGALVYEIVAGWRVVHYLIRVQQDPGYALIHLWPGSPLLVVASIAIIICIPFVAPRGPRQTKKHIPDPELSIRPR